MHTAKGLPSHRNSEANRSAKITRNSLLQLLDCCFAPIFFIAVLTDMLLINQHRLADTI